MSDTPVKQQRQILGLERNLRKLITAEVSRFVGVSYAQSSGQSIAHNTNTRVNFGTLIDDDMSAVTNPSTVWLFTCPVAGRYQINARIEFQGTTAWALGEQAILEVYKNGGTTTRVLDRRDDMNSGTTSQVKSLGGSTYFKLAAGDTIYINLYQNSGSSIALATLSARNWVDIYRIA